MRRQRNQCLARGRRGAPDQHAAALNAVRSGSPSLIGREFGIAFDIFYLVDADAELLAGHLAHGDAQTLAEIDLAAKQRHGAIAVDGKERIQLIRIEHPCRRRGALRAGA